MVRDVSQCMCISFKIKYNIPGMFVLIYDESKTLHCSHVFEFAFQLFLAPLTTLRFQVVCNIFNERVLSSLHLLLCLHLTTIMISKILLVIKALEAFIAKPVYSTEGCDVVNNVVVVVFI